MSKEVNKDKSEGDKRKKEGKGWEGRKGGKAEGKTEERKKQ